MNNTIHTHPQTDGYSPPRSARRPKRQVVGLFAAAGLILGLLSVNTAKADSFFDVYVDLWNGGGVVMSPVDSEGAFPFPPPPLDFPDLPTATGPVDIQMVGLSLRSSQPMVVGPPQPSGSFFVDSFFDIDYQINIDGGGSSNFHVDSFFDIDYRIEVTPGRSETSPQGERETFDIEIVSMNLSSAHPIPLPSGGNADLAIQLRAGSPAGFDGHVTVLKLAGTDNTFQVDSFFDVFVEISLDGSPPIPSEQDSQLRLASSETVPTPTGVGMLAVGLVAAVSTRRRGRHC